MSTDTWPNIRTVVGFGPTVKLRDYLQFRAWGGCKKITENELLQLLEENSDMNQDAAFYRLHGVTLRGEKFQVIP